MVIPENGTISKRNTRTARPSDTIFSPVMQKKIRKPLADSPVDSAPNFAASMSDQLWVRPNSNLIQVRKDANARAASGKKLLELADVALGLKKATSAKRSAKVLHPQAHSQVELHPKSKRALRSN